MTLDPRLVKDLDHAEGDRHVAYRDTEGLWTVGYGHLLPAGHDWTGYTITEAQALVYLEADGMEATHFAQRLPEWQDCDTDCRKNALIELCFNLGGRWLGFAYSRAAWQRKDWAGVKVNMLQSKWAQQVKGRSMRLANYIFTGQYP